MKTILMLSSLIASVSAVSASPLDELFNVAIYQGPGNGSFSDPNNQADKSNPLISFGHGIGIGTYTGALNLDEGASGTNTIGAFFTTAGSSIVGFAAPGAILSDSNYGTTTVMVFTGDTDGMILGGTISHDDGVSLYDGPGFTNVVLSSPNPTVDIPTDFAGLFGPFELIYVETNTLPAILDLNITSSVSNTPLPATLSMFAGGLGLFWWMKGRRKAPTSILGC